MGTKKIKAIFRGQEGSCGYRTNTEYNLVVSNKKNLIHIETTAGSGDCEYESIVGFLNNWDNIRTV